MIRKISLITTILTSFITVTSIIIVAIMLCYAFPILMHAEGSGFHGITSIFSILLAFVPGIVSIIYFIPSIVGLNTLKKTNNVENSKIFIFDSIIKMSFNAFLLFATSYEIINSCSFEWIVLLATFVLLTIEILSLAELILAIKMRHL